MVGITSAIDKHAGSIILFLIIIDFLLIGVLFVLFRQWSILRKNIFILKRGSEGESMVDLVSRHMREVQENTRVVEELSKKHDYILDVLVETIQRVAVVRFDAFEDMGGKLSYAVALLDDKGDGVVFTSIYGRNENRTYARAIKGGTSTHALTREEEEAIKRAMRMKPAILRTHRVEAKRVFDVQVEKELADFISQQEEDGSWTV